MGLYTLSISSKGTDGRVESRFWEQLGIGEVEILLATRPDIGLRSNCKTKERVFHSDRKKVVVNGVGFILPYVQPAINIPLPFE